MSVPANLIFTQISGIIFTHKFNKDWMHLRLRRRSQTAYTAPCNGIGGHGASTGGIWVFADHAHGTKCKQTESMIPARRGHLMGVYLHAQTTVDAGDICTWQITLISIAVKNLNTPPIGAPCRVENDTDSWISAGLNPCNAPTYVTPEGDQFKVNMGLKK